MNRNNRFSRLSVGWLPQAIALGTLLLAGGARLNGADLEDQTTTPGAPLVTAIKPPRAAQGSQLKIEVTGKNFAPGGRVSFSNPGIRVLQAAVKKSTEIEVHIEVAPDAPLGATSLFVVNPDDNEVEAAFEVTQAAGGATSEGSNANPAQADGGSAGPGGSASSAGDGPASSSPPTSTQNFGVINLGQVINILKQGGGTKGTLTVARGKLIYVEDGKQVFSVRASDVKEIAINNVLGIETGTFHIILNSGKTYNFIASSLRPADSATMVENLRRSLR